VERLGDACHWCPAGVGHDRAGGMTTHRLALLSIALALAPQPISLARLSEQ
jgi:hypothetical protein